MSAAFHTTPGYSAHPAPRSDPDDDREASTRPDTALSSYLARLESALSATASEGKIPELARLSGASEDQIGIALCTTDGEITAVGTEHVFPMQSISKAFAYGAAIDLHGLEYVTSHVDEEPTGEEFNAVSLDAVTKSPKNPLVNIGAIRTHAMLGPIQDERTRRLREVLDAAAGRALEVHQETFDAEMEAADRNLALAYMLRAAGSMSEDAEDVVRGYTEGCSVLVSVADLSVMAATLAAGGTNPFTGVEVFSRAASRQVLSVMLTCGMYDNAGDWVSDVGLPAKSGVGGGIIAALPSRFGIATYAPQLDQHGNSVRGTLAFEQISGDFAMHMLDGKEALDLERRAAELMGGP